MAELELYADLGQCLWGRAGQSGGTSSQPLAAELAGLKLIGYNFTQQHLEEPGPQPITSLELLSSFLKFRKNQAWGRRWV